MLVVNGRFLGNRYGVGVHRAARNLLDALQAWPVPLEVVGPRGAGDGRVQTGLWSPPGTLGLQFWEQVLLPAAIKGRPLLSLANTGPLAIRRQALFVFDISPRTGPAWFKRRFTVYMRAMITVARHAALVLTPSHQVADELARLGIAVDRTVVVPLAVDERFRPASEGAVADVRERYGLSRPYVLHLSWGDPRKDAATAVAAHMEAVRSCPHDLVLVGRQHPDFAPIRILEHPTVRRLDHVSDEELIPLMTGASALLYPTRYEGFGLPPLEAIACGTPAVVSDLPVLHETAGDRVSYCSPGDVAAWAQAILRALAGDLPVGPPATSRWRDAAAIVRQALEDRGLLE